MKCRFENDDRFTAEASAIGGGARFELLVKLFRQILDEKSGHDIEIIAV